MAEDKKRKLALPTVEQIRGGEVVVNRFDPELEGRPGYKRVFSTAGQELSRADLNQIDNLALIRRLANMPASSSTTYDQQLTGYDKKGNPVYENTPVSTSSYSPADIIKALGSAGVDTSASDTAYRAAESNYKNTMASLAPSTSAAEISAKNAQTRAAGIEADREETLNKVMTTDTIKELLGLKSASSVSPPPAVVIPTPPSPRSLTPEEELNQYRKSPVVKPVPFVKSYPGLEGNLTSLLNSETSTITGKVRKRKPITDSYSLGF